MRRVLVPGLLALSLSGCGLSTNSLTAGFADSGQPSSSLPPSRVASNDNPSAPPRKADDRAPKGTYEKAPSGALSDRDYTQTALDPEKARDVINGYRKQHGLKPLRLNTALTEAAKAHSRDLAKWDRISHFGSDGSNPWDRVKRAGFNAKVAAENVGTGQVSIEEVLKGWQTSPGHNKNLLLAEADQMGIALVQDPKTEFKTFWTLVVGSSN
ncbi:MAG: CAP domain-containing protein [Hyphomicrobiales bacterium]|nr:MAG: CAP domain-containing protein [Hyphomicrobiales bacterium]